MKSFSIEAKNGLCSADIKKRCCKVSFLYGYLYAGTDFRDREITFSFESDMIRKYVCKNFFDVFSIELESDRVITIDDGYTIGLLMETFLSDNDDGISDVIYTCENCSRYFMKGLFLSCGKLFLYSAEQLFSDSVDFQQLLHVGNAALSVKVL